MNRLLELMLELLLELLLVLLLLLLLLYVPHHVHVGGRKVLPLNHVTSTYSSSSRETDPWIHGSMDPYLLL